MISRITIVILGSSTNTGGGILIEEAVVLAAGMSERFRRSAGVHKALARLRGLPLVAYPITALALSGIGRIIVVVNSVYGTEIARAIDEAVERLRLGVELAYVVNLRPELGNGYSLYQALPLLRTRRFIVSMSDHIYPPSIVEKLASSLGAVLGGDSRPRYVDPMEATGIRVEDGVVRAVGKNITNPDYIDIGVHIMDTETPIMECMRHPYELSQILTCIASKTVLRVVDVEGAPWTDVDTLEDLREVEAGARRTVLEEVVREWRKRGLEHPRA